MRVLNFNVVLEPDETGGYVAICPILGACYSQGETVEEALINIKEAILLTIEDMRECGEPIPSHEDSLIATVAVEV